MKRLGQKICVAVALSLAIVAIWHDSAQAAITGIGSLGQIKDSSVAHPTRIDVDAAGTIYLCDYSVNGVTRYDKYGKALPTLSGEYQVRSTGVAVTPDGSRVFVAVAAPNSEIATAVAVINGSTGELLGYLGAGFNEFKRVVEIDLDGSGNVYVGNFDTAKTTTTVSTGYVTTAQVNVYDGTTYAKINSFGKPATNLVSGYYLPLSGEFGEIGGLTVDVVNKEVVVVEGWNNNGIARAQVFALDGTLKTVLTEANISGTQVNCKPVGVTVDPSGRYYMLSILTSTFHSFTTNPVAYLGYHTKTTPDPAYDAAGKVYPWTVGMIPTPSFDIVYDASTNRLFVVTDGNGIQIFSVDNSTNPPAKTNSAPQAPAILSPLAGGEVVSLTPTLQWSAAIDADNEPLTYNVKILSASGTELSTKNGVTTTSMTVAADTLVENNSYGWQVQAADAVVSSAYSAVESFWVNATEEAPTAALLDAPADAVTADKDTIFSWKAATDADPFDTVTYRLEIAKNGDLDFTAPVISVTQSGLTSAALSSLPHYDDLQSGTRYQWRVVSVDSTGLTKASAVRSFFSNSAPATPVVLGPVQGQEVATLTPVLQWEAAFDADGDALSYNVQIVDINGTSVSVINNIAATSFAVAGSTLLENNKYGWRVQAADAALTSAYSSTEYFWVNTLEEAPVAALLVGPENSVKADKDTVFSWQAAADVDPLATVVYRLEIAQDGDFTTPVISVEQDGLTSAALSTLPGYDALAPDTTYQWRVVAVDNAKLESVSEVRSFDYDSTIFMVDATFPGAKVYLGGNSAYSGLYVGEVPLELRDINPGTIEVVVELAGFEPWVKSVVVDAWQSISINAELVVAILPGEFKKASLTAGGLKIQGGAEAAPVYVDFDSDGIEDLLVADASGKLLFYKGVEGTEWSVASGTQVPDLTLPVGAVPFVADWNNDDRKDLLVGSTDGSVSLYLNEGTQVSPVFAEPVQLVANNVPLYVDGGNAAPLLFDLNNDGAKDLLVGSGKGKLYNFLNIGTDEEPLFASGEVLIDGGEGAVNASAIVTDWDADGSKEILLTANQKVALYERQLDGTYNGAGAPLVVHRSLATSKAGVYEMTSSSFGEKLRMVAANTDSKNGKDLLIGNAAGEILLAYSTINKVSAISPLFDKALLVTVAEIEVAIQNTPLATTQVISTLNQLKKNINSQAANKLTYYDKAKQNVVVLQGALSADPEISELLAKLKAQLSSDVPLN